MKNITHTKKENIEKLINNVDDEIYDTSDIDIEPVDNTKEKFNFNFKQEAKNKKIPKLHIDSVQQQNAIIGFDYIKLKLPLIHADDVGFSVDDSSFFRCKNPNIPALTNETAAQLLYNENVHYQQMTLTEDENNRLNSGEYVEQPFRLARLKYPNAKAFYDEHSRRLGLGHLYFNSGEFIVTITGKINSANGNLGLIDRNNIEDALDVIKTTRLVNFNNDAFIDRAEVLSTHVTNDLLVPNVNNYVKAFSSFLPIRTDKFNVLKYVNSGYEILARGRQTKVVPNYEFCIYNKGLEIREHHQKTYINRIGSEGLKLANNIIRLELRLQNFSAIRKFIVPNRKKDTVTLRELLECHQTPIREMLSILGITAEQLKKMRKNYITMVEGGKQPTQAELERMFGLIYLLKKNDYSLDKVRSYIEVETSKKTHSTYFQEKRGILQQYITCYMPQTVARLTEIIENISY